ncbi:hypothetical protein RJP21_09385 [Paenibacillus sp. VCA1]|nr:hypothetical protein [Paenibacillus sp. VCA1]MDR9853813.1 hypothetical protein [Paenibacillus sp. VCA1]
MNYEPAPLDEEAVLQLREYERQLSQAAGYPVILIAYADQEQPPAK